MANRDSSADSGAAKSRERRSGTFSRGVWWAPFRDPTGNRVAVAVASNGRMVGWEVVPEGTSIHEVSEELWVRLDRRDPMPDGEYQERRHLRLVE